jgi:hypothetical protein
MATYTLDSLKELILRQANKIPGLSVDFDPQDADEAYATACQECSFSFPDDTDEDVDKKYLWIKKRMIRWFVEQVWNQRMALPTVGDLKTDALGRNLQRRLQKLDDEFKEAKEDPATSYLFVAAQDVFGDVSLVQGPGLEEDRIGEDISVRT